MGAGKDYWIDCYERATHDLAEEHDISFEEAEKMLERYLEEDPSYLNNYITYEE